MESNEKQRLLSIGFDLGTTYSSIAFAGTQLSAFGEIQPTPQIATDQTGTNIEKQFIPSEVCAYLEKDKLKWAVGNEAIEKNKLLGEDAHLYENYKLYIGSTFPDREYTRHPINPDLRERLTEETPDRVARRLVEHLFDLAFSPNWGLLNPERDKVRSVSVTVPALWPEDYVRIVRGLFIAALDLFGTPKIRTLEEPIAALYHQIHSAPFLLTGPEKNVLVIDYGGGTCDIAVVRIKENAAKGHGDIGQVVGRCHKDRGGVLIDDLIAKHLRESLSLEESRSWYLSQAERLKIEYAKQLRDLNLPGLTHELHYTIKDHKIVMGVQEFSELIQPELQWLEPTIGGALKDASDYYGQPLTLDDIRHVFLAGGTSLLPIVKEKVTRIFNKSVEITDRDARKAIAYGASRHAFKEDTGYGLRFGVTAKEDIWLSGMLGGIQVVEKGQSFPYEDRHVIYTGKWRLEEFRVSLYKGKRLFPAGDKRIKEKQLELSKPARLFTRFVFEVSVDSTGFMEFVLKRPNHPEDTFSLECNVPIERDLEAMARRVGLKEAEAEWETL